MKRCIVCVGLLVAAEPLASCSHFSFLHHMWCVCACDRERGGMIEVIIDRTEHCVHCGNCQMASPVSKGYILWFGVSSERSS